MLSFNLPGATGCRFHSRASGAAIMRQRESLIGVAWGARPKPGPASPANVSKRGLFARLYVPNQTLILVNARLPQGDSTTGNRGRPGGYEGEESSSLVVPRPSQHGTTEIWIRDLAALIARALPEILRPLMKRAQGRPGARCTRGLACNVHRECAHEHTGSAESIRPSLRNGFTAYSELSPENGSFASVAPWEVECLPGA